MPDFFISQFCHSVNNLKNIKVIQNLNNSLLYILNTY